MFRGILRTFKIYHFLHDFIKERLLPFHINLQLLLRLGNLPHKCMGLDLHLDQVSCNCVSVRNLAVFYDLFK